MYKNITLVAFISAFALTACGGGGSSTVPTGNGSSSKSALSSATLSSSKSSLAASSVVSVASSTPSSVSSASAPGETASSSVATSSSVAPASSSVASSSVVVPPVSSSVSSSSIKSNSSSVKSSSSSVNSSSSSVKSSSSSVKSSSSSVVSSSSSSVSSGPASIYHVRGSFNGWNEGTLMLPTSTANTYELCVNFTGGDGSGGPRFKIDPNGGYGDSVPSADYAVAVGWVKISFNSTTKAITVQQNLPANCGGSSSSSAVASSVISSSSSSVASSSKSSSSSSAPSSSSSSAPSSSSSSAASSLGPHHAGEDCQSCHKVGGEAEKKIFTISGTVYKARTSTAAVNPEASIVIMDNLKLNEVIRMKADANGNFYSYQSLGGLALLDLHPRAIGASGVLNPSNMMSAAPTSGSCNSCHNRTDEAEAIPIWVN